MVVISRVPYPPPSRPLSLLKFLRHRLDVPLDVRRRRALAVEISREFLEPAGTAYLGLPECAAWREAIHTHVRDRVGLLENLFGRLTRACLARALGGVGTCIVVAQLATAPRGLFAEPAIHVRHLLVANHFSTFAAALADQLSPLAMLRRDVDTMRAVLIVNPDAITVLVQLLGTYYAQARADEGSAISTLQLVAVRRVACLMPYAQRLLR